MWDSVYGTRMKIGLKTFFDILKKKKPGIEENAYSFVNQIVTGKIDFPNPLRLN